MDNYAIAENFSLLSKLMDIHGENTFKTRIYGAAAFNIEKMPVQLRDVESGELFRIKGIGESVGNKVLEMIETGELGILREFLDKTPAGVVELLNIKGIGPKKINTIWKEMGIESVGELLYACNENRLTMFKGFGEKTQKNVQDSINFYLQNQGTFLYAQIDALYPSILAYMQKLFSPGGVHVTGAFRRQSLTIDELEFVVAETNEKVKPKFQTAQPPELLEEKEDSLLYKLKNGLKLRLYTGKDKLQKRLFETTGSAAFLEAFTKKFPENKPGDDIEKNDEPVFTRAGIPYIPPCLRESEFVIEQASNLPAGRQGKKLPVLIQPGDIRAIIHSHSNWSDGVNTIEEMAKESIRRGHEYLVISDHSKTAFYANGLNEERLREQQRHIDQLNQQLQPFRIFKSIESDILNDGSLDYTNKILDSFDLVIASVHSNLQMTEEKAMSRVMKAIENPYTTILGHMTGRLLLTRNGFPLDHKKIIEACVANQVVIELNAHPRRLDIDWKWIGLAIEKGALLSIDPDAHALEGYDDIKYGVLAAQKGGMQKENNLSSYTLKQFEEFLAKRRKLKKI